MFTLCWSGKNKSDWDRFNTIPEMEEKVKELIKEGCSNEDMLVFSNRLDNIVPEEDGSIIFY